MIRIATEKDLLDSFRSLDRESVEVPRTFEFPLIVKDYLAWTEPSGHRTYLVFSDGAKRPPLGIVFERSTDGGASSQWMCEWCHSVRSGDGVSLLVATASSRKRVGLHLCRDLSCKEKILAEPVDGGSEYLRIKRIVSRMGEFARRALF